MSLSEVEASEGRRDGSEEEEGRITSPERGEEDLEEVGVSSGCESVVSEEFEKQKKEESV